MKIPKGFLFALIIIFIAAFVTVGFSQEDKKESTPQEKTTVDQKPSEKDLKPEEEKKPEEKKSTPSEEAQEKYDEAELLRESQRIFDRSISILNIIVTSIGVLVGLFTLIIIIAIAFGVFEIRSWKEARRKIEEDAKYIKELRIKGDEYLNDLRKIFDKTLLPSSTEEPTKEYIEMLNDFNRRLAILETFGLPLKAKDYVIRGFDLYYKGKYEVALDAFERSIKLDVNNDLAWLGKSRALKKVKRNEEALKAIDKAIELKPDFLPSLNDKGGVFYALGRYKEALDVANKAIELQPDYVIAWSNKALALDKLERYEEALDAANKAIEFKADFANAWSDKASALSKLERYEEAFDAVNKAIEFEPTSAFVWFNRACIYSLKGKKKEALKDLSKAIELNAEAKERAKKDKDFKWLWKDEEFIKITS